MDNTYVEVAEWLQSQPKCFNGTRVVDTACVFEDYNSWAVKNRCLTKNGPALGLALKRLIPNIYGKQIKRDGVRIRVYVLPRDFANEAHDDLL